MPCLRIFSPYVPPAQKRLIVQKLLEITSRAFQFRAEDRHRINIQFILLPRLGSVTGLEPEIPRDADFFLEVNDHGLTEDKKRAFAKEVSQCSPNAGPNREPGSIGCRESGQASHAKWLFSSTRSFQTN